MYGETPPLLPELDTVNVFRSTSTSSPDWKRLIRSSPPKWLTRACIWSTGLQCDMSVSFLRHYAGIGAALRSHLFSKSGIALRKLFLHSFNLGCYYNTDKNKKQGGFRLFTIIAFCFLFILRQRQGVNFSVFFVIRIIRVFIHNIRIAIKET